MSHADVIEQLSNWRNDLILSTLQIGKDEWWYQVILDLPAPTLQDNHFIYSPQQIIVPRLPWNYVCVNMGGNFTPLTPASMTLSWFGQVPENYEIGNLSFNATKNPYFQTLPDQWSAVMQIACPAHTFGAPVTGKLYVGYRRWTNFNPYVLNQGS